jgi:hypothetical protein
MKEFPAQLRLGGALALAVLLVAGPALADYVGRTPPRLSLVEGEVSLWRAGSSEWEPAEVNLPLGPGDFLFTGPSSRLELQIGPRAFARAADETLIGVVAHEGDFLRLDVGQGRASLDLRDLAPGARVEVDTPHGELAVGDPGLYDIDVSAGRATFAARQGGRGTVRSGADTLDLRPGAQVVAADGTTRLADYQAPPPDGWLQWNSERTDRILAATSRSYVSEDIYGIHDLDAHGRWREEPRYGRVWVPSAVPAGWAPYTTGRWLWDGAYGWTWVDAAPWGWAPYHYGRWVYVDSHWGWAPGPILVRPAYSPALVAFLGGPSISVGVSIGVPFVSWVALGWGEPVIPWWGPSWYRGRPCWTSWGGPTIINNVYVDRRRRVRVHDIKHYSHQRRRDAVVAVPRDGFARRAVHRERLRDVDHRQLRPTRGDLPIRPREAGVAVPRDRSRTRPPRPEGMQAARGGTRPTSPELRRGGSRDAAGGDPRSRRGTEAQAARPRAPERPMTGRERLGGSAADLAARSARRPPSGAAASDSARPVRPLPPRQRAETSLRPRADGVENRGGGSRTRPAPPVASRQRSAETVAARPQPPVANRQRLQGALPARPDPRAQAAAVPPRVRPDLTRPRRGDERRAYPIEQPRRPEVPRAQAPQARSSYSAPEYQGFERAPNRLEVPRVEAPRRVEAPPVAAAPRGAPAAREPRVESAPAPRFQAPSQQFGGDYSSAPRGRDRGAAPAMRAPGRAPAGGGSRAQSRPQRSR